MGMLKGDICEVQIRSMALEFSSIQGVVIPMIS